jgi:glycosidase
MPSSLYESDQVAKTLDDVRQASTIQVAVPGQSEPKLITKPFPSPVDWRDHWIYFLMIDRFNNPATPPKKQWDRETEHRQGGNFEGVRAQLAYIKNLGAGAIWLTPVLKNRLSQDSHHGYGIQDFLEVDPRFGTVPEKAETELINLINEAHAQGLYVILDVVINHAGDIFAYDVDGEILDSAPWKSTAYTAICWRDENGNGRRDWPTLPSNLSRNAGIWPSEFQSNEWFRRQGKGGDVQGDFETLKEFKTELSDFYYDKPVWNILIKAYQYAIAKFDVDGFRIDTLKHVERDFGIVFCNAIREFALLIGKKNFFIFGEIKGEEEVIAQYTGRNTSDEAGRIGADAALDFPVQWQLGPVVKGWKAPTELQDVFDRRKKAQQYLLSTHGEASRFFVTFLDNHDDHNRFLYPRDGGDYSPQLILALGCLFGLQGIPCVYYGTEQGLKGTQEIYDPNYTEKLGKPEHVREALWGKPNAFDQAASMYQQIKQIAEVRGREPALRYGRQYFRQVSGNNCDFGFSKEKGGVIAFSRILNDREVIVVANASTASKFSGWVVIDARINSDNTRFKVAYSNHGTTGAGNPVGGYAKFYDRNNSPSDGWARRLHIELAPMEIQILTQQ